MALANYNKKPRVTNGAIKYFIKFNVYLGESTLGCTDPGIAVHLPELLLQE